MRTIVSTEFPGFTAQYEGVVYEMYTDVLGLVTTGIGNLIDPLVAALGLPWLRRSDGAPATQAEIASEWHRVKDGKLAWYPGRAPRPLYLTTDAVNDLVRRRLAVNESYFVRRWPNWASVPADGQMACHSIAWAAGSAWYAPHFDAAMAALDFHALAGPPGDAGGDPGCRGHGWLNDTGNPGLRPRNLANKALLQNAAIVLSDGYDPDKLYWPMRMDG